GSRDRSPNVRSCRRAGSPGRCSAAWRAGPAARSRRSPAATRARTRPDATVSRALRPNKNGARFHLMTGRSEDYHAALASTSRRQILDALVASTQPLDAAVVAGGLGLHVTTARFHLDQLTDAGLVRRRPSTERRRGRPRML